MIRVLAGWMARRARGLTVDGRLVATVSSILAVRGCVIAPERRVHPVQRSPRPGKLLAPARRPVTRTGLVEPALALILQAVAVVIHPLALVRSAVTPIRLVFAEVRLTVALVSGCIATICHHVAPDPLGGVGAVGGVTLGLGAPLRELGGVLIPPQRTAMQLGGPPMEIDQPGLRRLGHEALAAFRGLPLAACVLARAVAVQLRPSRPVAMLVGGHDRKVLRTAAIRDGSYERVVP